MFNRTDFLVKLSLGSVHLRVLNTCGSKNKFDLQCYREYSRVSFLILVFWAIVNEDTNQSLLLRLPTSTLSNCIWKSVFFRLCLWYSIRIHGLQMKPFFNVLLIYPGILENTIIADGQGISWQTWLQYEHNPPWMICPSGGNSALCCLPSLPFPCLL